MSAGTKNPDIAPPRLRELQAFYTGRLHPESGPLTSRMALLLTTRFLNYYHHAVPFDRHVLEAVWDRCEGAGCAPGRLQIEKYLWGLEAARQ